MFTVRDGLKVPSHVSAHMSINTNRCTLCVSCKSKETLTRSDTRTNNDHDS